MDLSDVGLDQLFSSLSVRGRFSGITVLHSGLYYSLPSASLMFLPTRGFFP